MIEADFEIAFNLIDLSRVELERGDRDSAFRALRDAEDVFEDIERRLDHIGVEKSHHFDPLVAELKRAIGAAKSQDN